MFPLRKNHAPRLLVLATVAFPLAMGTLSARGQDHDVVTFGTWATPQPLTCESRVCARLYSAGQDNYQIQSGQCSIHFSYQWNGGAWTPVGDLPVVWDPWGDGLAWGEFWPSDASEEGSNNCVEFSAPKAGDYRFQAETTCLGISDVNTADNIGQSATYSAAQSCISAVAKDPCQLFKGRFEGREGWRLICDDIVQIGEAVCDKYPGLCVNRCDLDPLSCGGGVDLCSLSPLCHDAGPIEVLFDDRMNGLNLAVINLAGTVIAKGDTLRKPVVRDDVAYNQRIRLKVAPDETYYLAFWPGKGTKLHTNLPFPVLVQEQEADRK